MQSGDSAFAGSIPASYDRYLGPALFDPYAADLDIFGKGSLFELLNTARTRSGEETLNRWLLSAAAREEILARQAAVHRLGARKLRGEEQSP